ncbi:Calcium-binding EF-hand family protein [Perilla frutescens var. hirtella]|uniref:Calcium-binding EF-hand family protein n=1 Tax=Perilla frutescens var. hirtella TaxID=608512 RepID=A0AAD4NWT2_PERFH|nr:Calcium-binding EF-hand family protein [Perilla frutescens var. hirtella]
MREAFDVFDDNRDGSIDENELKRVVCALGFKEELKVVSCRRMIEAFDEDEDGHGRIDFQEFVKFMENGCKSNNQWKEKKN